MSYCRWSSDDWQCDVYVYDDVIGGITIHVAAKRRTFLEPLPPAVSLADTTDAWYARHVKVMALPYRMDHIGGRFDGESFNVPNAEEAVKTLTMIRDAGYNVPQRVIDTLREEAAGP